MLNHVNSEILDLNNIIFSKFEKLCDEVYIYRNFLSKEECDEIIKNAKEDDNPIYFENKDPEAKTLIAGGRYRCSLINKYRERFSDLLNYDEDGVVTKDIFYSSAPWDNAVLRVENGGDPVHTDLYNYINEAVDNSKIKKTEIYSENLILPFATSIIYFSEDFDGGQIYYPEYSVEHKPSSGDMIVHNSQVIHGVRPISNGERWNFQNSFSANMYLSKESLDRYDMSQSDWWQDDFDNRNKNGDSTKEFNKEKYNDSAKGIHEKEESKNKEKFFYRIDQRPITNRRLLDFAKKQGFNTDRLD
jgi:hypothetical protein